MKCFYLSLLCLFIAGLDYVCGFALYMTRRHCEIPIVEGISIMGTVTEINLEKSLKLFQGDLEIVNGSVIHSSGNLTVKVDPRSTELVLEVVGAKFEYGLCGGTRSNTNGAKLIIEQNSDALVEVKLLAAWAKTYSGGVKIVPPFTFYYQQLVEAQGEL